MRTVEERFWSRVSKGNDCWEWIGLKFRLGYGSISVNGRMASAHRVSWEIHNGPIPDGRHVLHRCDNRACVNPSHLYCGTHQDNMRDRDSRGRGRIPRLRGAEASMAKLSETEVTQIRRLYQGGGVFQRELAKKFNVGRDAIGKIVRGERWQHLLQGGAQ